MDVRHHGADVASSVGLSTVLQPFQCCITATFQQIYLSNQARLLRQPRYLRELLLLQILCDSRLKVFGVTFVQAVNLAALLDPHVPIHQDKFAERLRGKEKER